MSTNKADTANKADTGNVEKLNTCCETLQYIYSSLITLAALGLIIYCIGAGNIYLYIYPCM